MLSVRAALDLVLRDLPSLGCERVSLLEATGRILGEDVRSLRDVPPFRNSAMDGYAVRFEDISEATSAEPVSLKVLETIGAGKMPVMSIVAGTASRIMTGSPVPPGADTVVKIEDTNGAADTVEVRATAKLGANIRQPGEDVRRGDTVLLAGHTLRPADIGVLASIGDATVLVRRRPMVAIAATGDELVELGQPLAPGQIANSNAYTLAAAVAEAGGVPRILGIVPDDLAITRNIFGEALHADIVLSTGGVSMGLFDLVRKTLADLGVEERFWKVAQKPGKPLSFGMRGSTPFFGLPGNPVSSLVCFYVYVRPALRAMMGSAAVHFPVVRAILDGPIKTAAGVTEFVRCVLERHDNSYRVHVTGTQSSGVLRSMSLGNGLIIAPPNVTTLESGVEVQVLRLTDESVTEPPF